MSDYNALAPANRIEEYKTLVAETSAFIQHAQTTNSSFFTVNALFITALGVLLVSTHLQSWWNFGVVSFITILITPANWVWQGFILRNRKAYLVRCAYLREIERDLFVDQVNHANKLGFGLFQRLEKEHLEIGPWILTLGIFVFPYFYLFLTVFVGVLTYLVMNHAVPPLELSFR